MKKAVFSVVLCLILILSGCAQRGNELPESSSSPQTTPVQSDSALPSVSVPVAEAITDSTPPQTSSPPSSSEVTVTPIAVKQANFSSIQGKIKGIYPADGSKVLVLADQLSLYDLASGKIAATAQTPTLSTIRVLALDSGYAVVGQTISENSTGGFVLSDSAFQFRAVIYDENLVLKSEIDISKLVEDGGLLVETEAIAISPDGNTLAFATLQQGIMLYDRVNQKSTKLIALTGNDDKNNLGLSIIEQIGFTNNGKSVAFKAQSFDVPAVNNKPSFDTVGTVNIDGSGLTNKKPGGYSPKMLTSYPSRLLIAEDFKTASGRMMVIDSKTGEQKTHKLSDKKEGGNIYGSDTGRYFASSVPSRTGWTVRVYESDTGKLVKEESISNDGQELYGINDPMICVVDNAKTCMVLLGHKQAAVSTKVASFSF
ncbi:hypothetical protein [Oscillibacter sp.]|uniref:hypothetical protein n=1 Tax=Oscillibacter sp. TaxID=1945593 RepID=UPI0028981A28|nr:hypothetical protein [Oscillibacter sp.]